MQFQVTGKCSGKTYKLAIAEQDLNKTMLNFLREKEIGIASSCRGEKVCHLCAINSDILSCAITVKDFWQQHGPNIIIDYL